MVQVAMVVVPEEVMGVMELGDMEVVEVEVLVMVEVVMEA